MTPAVALAIGGHYASVMDRVERAVSTPRTKSSRRVRNLPLAAALALLSVPSYGQTEPEVTCRSTELPVTISAGVSGSVVGTLCVPEGARTVQLLVHGFTYGQYYWDLPYEPETYSFVRAANAAGFATLNIDRLGNVGSFQPLSVFVTLENNARVVHELVQALRDGRLGASFDAVVLVGHSFGSLISYLEAGRYQDVDAIVATGASHQVNAVNVLTRLLAQSPPATLDPKFAGLLLDPGYVTTLPGRRGMFYSDNVDPAIVSLDESLKQTDTIEDALTYLPDYVLNASRAINLPVLSVNGQKEPFFCNGLLAGDCSSSEALARSERRFYGPDAVVDAIVVPGAGHNVTLERDAEQTNAAILGWIEARGF